MKARILWVVLAVVLVAALTACPGPADPEPQPTNTPAPPTPSPTPTFTPTPTPTPTATPTATPIPPTPTPTLPPTPTPTPGVVDIQGFARDSAVRLSLGERRWTGVLIDSRGYIITTSRNMGQSPLVDYETPSGQSGQAWTIGRNDTWDVALLEVISGGAGYDLTNRFGSTTPGIGEDVLVFGYPATEGSALDQRQTQVLGSQSSLNTGINYFQIQAPIPSGVEGGAIFGLSGHFTGMRMSDAFMEEIGLGRAGESYGVSIDSLEMLMLPQLLGGLAILEARPAIGNDAAPPALPTTFTGTVRLGNAVVGEGQFPVYARISKPGQPDIWVRSEIGPNGVYHLPVAAPSNTYSNATIEFWGNRVQAAQMQTFTPGWRTVTLNLTFPSSS